jgi:microcompartment protein CcmL/EutN
MDEKALGLIETFGLIPAVEAADAAVKSASVELEGFRMVGAGLVTILMRGDVSSVKASVDAGKASAEKLGEVISAHVIARTGEGLEDILPDPEKKAVANETSQDELDSADEISDEEYESIPEPEEAIVVETDALDSEIEEPEQAELVFEDSLEQPSETEELEDELIESESPDKEIAPEKKVVVGKSALKKMNVTKLRELARKTPGLAINRKDIKSARKKELIEAIYKANQ